MIWITKVILENFQSHKYTVLNFNEGLNAIIGSTDSGKTAIFRGIKWALFNEPQGDYFIREGASDVSVEIHFSTGVKVKRYRGKSVNGYKLVYPDGEESIFEGFGTKVPDEILEATQMKKMNISNRLETSINLAEQLDPPFLLSESSSAKAAAIGRLVEADIVDQALSDTNLDLRNKKREENEKKEELKTIEKELENYEYLDDLRKDIENLEKLREKISLKDQCLKTLEKLKIRLENIESSINKEKDILKNTKKLDEIEIRNYKIENKYVKLKSLDRLNKNLKINLKNQDVLKNYNLKLEVTEDLSKKENTLTNFVERYKKLLNIYKILEKIEKEKKNINYIHNELKDISKIEKIGFDIQIAENRYKNLRNINKRLMDLDKRLNVGKVYIEKFKDLDESEQIQNKLEEKLLKLNEFSKLNNKLKTLEKDKIIENKNLKNINKNILSYTNEYEELISKLQICPTCFRPIDKHSKEKIKEHLID